MLKALPLDFVKYLEIVVVAVWDIIPWPENLIRNIEINNSAIEFIFEKKKQENESKIITKKANLEILISSIFFPTQISNKLLSSVAGLFQIHPGQWQGAGPNKAQGCPGHSERTGSSRGPMALRAPPGLPTLPPRRTCWRRN